MSSAQRQHQQVPVYRELLTMARQVLSNARHTATTTEKLSKKHLTDPVMIAALRHEITHYCDLGDRAVDQAERRILNGEQVPASEKIFSIFEPHTDLIKRGKVNKPVEFGHKVFLAESANGLITQYRVLDGNPADEDHVESCLKTHKKTFGAVPQVFAADRGFDSNNNQKLCRKARIECASIPQRGGIKTSARQALEKTPEFKKAQRFRAGIEGRISVLFRGRGMKRCLSCGRQRFDLFVGVTVLANNLLKIAELLVQKHKPRRRAA